MLSLLDQKSVLDSYKREIALKEKKESDALKVFQADLKEVRKQISNLTNQLIGEKHVVQGHMNQMELNEQCQTMNIVSHVAKLGTTMQTKAELLAQSQLEKAMQFTMYSTNVGGGMRGIGSGGVQVPHMAIMNAMGGNNGMMNDMLGIGMINGMGGGNCGFNSFQGMTNLNYGGGMGKIFVIIIIICYSVI